MSFHILVPVGVALCLQKILMILMVNLESLAWPALVPLQYHDSVTFFVATKGRNRSVHSSLWGKRSVASICEKFWQLQIESCSCCFHVLFMFHVWFIHVWCILHVFSICVSCFITSDHFLCCFMAYLFFGSTFNQKLIGKRLQHLQNVRAPKWKKPLKPCSKMKNALQWIWIHVVPRRLLPRYSHKHSSMQETVDFAAFLRVIRWHCGYGWRCRMNNQQSCSMIYKLRVLKLSISSSFAAGCQTKYLKFSQVGFRAL